MDSALSPYRVLDLTDEKGFTCGKLLADMGADVIKVEPPIGDPARQVGPFYRDQPDPNNSLYWWHANTSKRAITLNLETTEGRAILRRLAAGADFLLECFAPGYLAGLGLGFEELRRLNPGLISVSITPFGQTGPYSSYQATDIVGVAMGGLMWLCGDPDRPPVRIGAPQAYLQVSLQAAVAAMIALQHRHLSGEGQHVDVSMQEAVTWTMIPNRQYWDLNGMIIRRLGSSFPAVSKSNRLIFECKGGFVSVLAPLGRQFQTLLAWMVDEGLAEDLIDERWFDIAAGGPEAATQEELDYIASVVARFLLERGREELCWEGQKRGVIIFPVNSPGDLLSDEQLRSRGYFVKVDHPDLEHSVTYPGAPYMLTETPWRIGRPPPRLGEHNDEVLHQELGLQDEDMRRLRAAGVI